MNIKRKMQYRLISMAVFFCVLLSGTMQAAGVSDNSSKPASYTTLKGGTIRMLPGEYRAANTSAPTNASFTSSNQKIATVTNTGRIYARKPGTVTITQTVDNVKTKYTVKIIKEVNLIIFAGQSNMCGSGGNSAIAPTPAIGTAYEFDISTGTNRCITMKEPFGEGTNRVNGLDDNGVYSTKGTLASAFTINFYKKTKVPVVGVSACWGGASTNTWLNRGLATTACKRITMAKKFLKKKGVKIRHIYVVWLQGESDVAKGESAAVYKERMKKIYKKFKAVGVQKCFVIQIGEDLNNIGGSNTIMNAQNSLCKENKNFIMVSQLPKKLVQYRSGSWYKYYYDSVHFNQNALNKIGYDAGKNAAKYVN